MSLNPWKIRVKRLIRITRASSKLATRVALRKAHSAFSSQDNSKVISTREINTALDVAQELGSMRGVMAKFGQMLSYVSSPLPSELRNEFSMLQDRAPIMSNQLVEQIILSELGDTPERLFETWDPNPIASASIGQVHRAITKDGVAIALKIQFPQVAQTLTADLANLKLIAKSFKVLYPAMDTNSIVDEISDRIVEELDYLQEAKNQSLFHTFYRDHPYVSIPKVIEKFSTS